MAKMPDTFEVTINASSSELDDLLYDAWCVIANAHGGAWDLADPEWKAAAERWRDRFHAHLDVTAGRTTGGTETAPESP